MVLNIVATQLNTKKKNRSTSAIIQPCLTIRYGEPMIKLNEQLKHHQKTQNMRKEKNEQQLQVPSEWTGLKIQLNMIKKRTLNHKNYLLMNSQWSIKRVLPIKRM